MGKGSKRRLAMRLSAKKKQKQIQEEETTSEISFVAKEYDLVQWKGDLMAVGVAEKDLTKDENSRFQNSILGTLDSLLGGLLAIATKEEFKGKCGKCVVLRLNNHSFDMIGLIGLGQGDSTKSTYSSFGEDIVAVAEYTQAQNIGVVLASSEGLSDESKFIAASAITNGIVLGIHEGRSNLKSKKPVLRTVDFHGLGSELENKLKYADIMSNCHVTTSVHGHHKAQNPPTTAFPSCSLEQKFTSTQVNTSPPLAKRCKFVEKMNTTGEEGQTEKPQEGSHSFDTLVPSAPGEISSVAHTLSGAGMALTEIVGMAEKDAENEVVSSFKPALGTLVDGYRVKTEYASRIRSIFKKHGNIAEKGPQLRRICSCLLETVCEIIERLENLTFKEITSEELKDMIEKVAEIGSSGIQVQWLLNNLNDITMAKNNYTEVSSIKLSETCTKKAFENTKFEVQGHQMMLSAKQEEVEKMKAKIQELEDEMVPLKERLNLSKEKLAGLKTKSEEINVVASDARKNINRFIHKSLVEGLL